MRHEEHRWSAPLYRWPSVPHRWLRLSDLYVDRAARADALAGHRPPRIVPTTVASPSDSAKPRRTIRETFDALRARGEIALLPFIPAGYPDLATTLATLPALEAAGADGFEIGFPFSDPIADGPTVQEAFTAALSTKLKVADVFETIATAQSRVSIPLVSMLSYSIVFRYGVERFASSAKQAGFDGLILPDLPPPEAQRI